MASPNSSFRILEVTRVGPLFNSLGSAAIDSAAKLTLPLTFFDILWMKFPPVERVFFYRLTESAAESPRQYFESVILPKLKSSLSLALCHYLPLCGHLVWDPQEPKPCIRYSRNDAVELTVTESEADFSHLSCDEQRVATELHPLVPELVGSDDSSSIISIQITLFPTQGFCIGVTAHHAILDGKTTTTFIKSWAHICKQELEQEKIDSYPLPQDLTPFFDRTVIKDPTGLDMKILNAWLSFTKDQSESKNLKLLPSTEVATDVVRVTFRLTRENIKRLRERVKNESSEEHSKELHLSTFVITYAYMLTCMVSARGGDSDRPVFFVFAADYRTRLDPPIPLTYFGNCVGAAAKLNAKAWQFMEEKGFLSAAKIVSDLVIGLDLGALGKIPEIVEGMKRLQPGTQIGSIAGSTWLGVYETDFGWGKPVKVEIVSIDANGAISLAESRDGSGGVEVGLCLKRDEMEVLASLFVDGLKNL